MIQPQKKDPRFIVEIILVENGESRKIAAYNSAATVPLPEVGDEIGFNDEAKEKLGTKSTVFKVIKRRFPVALDQMFTPSVFLFVESPSSNGGD